MCVLVGAKIKRNMHVVCPFLASRRPFSFYVLWADQCTGALTVQYQPKSFVTGRWLISISDYHETCESGLPWHPT